MIIGITGKSCAGKDFLCQMLLVQNPSYDEINLDAIGHSALEQKKQAVLEAFSEVFLETPANVKADPAKPLSPPSEKNTIDRKKLGRLVFRNPAALHKLESILHPQMKKLALAELRKAELKKAELRKAELQKLGQSQNESAAKKRDADVNEHANPKIIINAALLEKLELLPHCDLVLWVQAPLLLRAWRAMQRDKLPLLQFLRRDKAQRTVSHPALSHPEKSKNLPAQYLIKNNRLINSCALSQIHRQLQSIPQLQQEFATDR